MGGGRDVHDAPSIKNYGFDEYISTYESPDPEPAIRVARSEIPTTGLMKVLADMVRST